tara:strand:- start:309 stop:563 length:255 start_codon:yes stop_codon:yes gene_type:complete
MSIKLTTETTHDDVQIHLKNEDIEITSVCLKYQDITVLNFGDDLSIYLSPEQAVQLHRTINESVTDHIIDTIAIKEELDKRKVN